MKKKWIAVLMLILIVFVASCSGWRKESIGEGVTPQYFPPGPAPTISEEAAVRAEKTTGLGVEKSKSITPDQDRMVIKTKQVRLEVVDVIETKNKIEQIVRDYKGYVSSLSTSSGDDFPHPLPKEKESGKKDRITQATIETKIPANRMDSFVKEVKNLGKLDSEAEQAQDIEREYTDLSARLRNQKAAEERLLQMYNAAKTVKEMLEIEAQLTAVRGEIESLQAQIDYYDQAVAMATITLDIHEPAEISLPEWRKNFSDAFNKAIDNFMNVIVGLIGLSGGCLALSIPLALLALVVYVIVKLFGRRRKKL